MPKKKGRKVSVPTLQPHLLLSFQPYSGRCLSIGLWFVFERLSTSWMEIKNPCKFSVLHCPLAVPPLLQSWQLWSIAVPVHSFIIFMSCCFITLQTLTETDVWSLGTIRGYVVACEVFTLAMEGGISNQWCQERELDSLSLNGFRSIMKTQKNPTTPNHIKIQNHVKEVLVYQFMCLLCCYCDCYG